MAKKSKKAQNTSKPDSVSINLTHLPKESDPSLQLIWVDRMELACRGDVPISTLRFYTGLLDRTTEACRLQTTNDHLRRMVDVICGSIDYYPTKAKASRA